MLDHYRVEWYSMVMTREERVARINQIRDQITSLNEELQKLANEDDQYSAYIDRARVGAKNALAYADFARVASAWEKLEAAWVRADRPTTWGQLPLLNRLRDVLIVTGSPEPESAPEPQPEPEKPVDRPAPISAGPGVTAVSTAPSQNASGVRSAVGTATGVGARALVPSKATPSRPDSGGTESASISTPDKSTAGVANPAPPLVAASRSPSRAPIVVRHVSREQLVEMHTPIIKELGEIVKRAEDELRTAQYANGSATLDWATYLLERVVSPSPPLIARLTKALDEVLRGGATIQDADRTRLEELRVRIARLATDI